ncbi:MAG TPA: COX15/CtaA family protein [Gemmatimonadales bacterium]
MTRRYSRLAWTAAACTYLLIILGAVVRITGSGLGCGEHWPLCNGRLLPPLDLPTWIEWSHRLVAGLVTALVAALAAYTWWLRRGMGTGDRESVSRVAYVALVLLAIQIALGAVTVKLSLPPWTVILHLGTAMLLLATLLTVARGLRPTPGASPGKLEGALLLLTFVTVLLGALVANLGAATACLGFPLCNGQLMPDGNYTQHIHWTHRLFAYTLFAVTLWWAQRTRRRGPAIVFALVMLQLTVGATMVLLGLPRVLQAAHVAVGAAVWSAVVLAAL